MTDPRWLVADKAALGLAIAALGCAARDPGFTLDNDGETGFGEAPTGGDDPSGDGDGDTGPNDVPFELVSASFNATGQFVALRFSEPVAPVDGVDPSDFRISYALLTALCTGNGECTDQTSYWDPNFYVEYYLTYPPDPSHLFETDLVAPGNQATDIFLRFKMPLDPTLCEYIQYYEDDYDFLFVHYAPGDIPVKSTDGESLAAIGAHWVEQPAPLSHVDGYFPNLNPKIPIPCSL